MNDSQHFVGRMVPERFVEVDAARLLLILHHFSSPADDQVKGAKFYPLREVERHFTPEYYLQKLDFLVRYPGYFAYEIIELHRLKITTASDPNDIRSKVHSILNDREPELRTQPFRRFWYGAHERLNEVEAWWHARGLIFTGIERRRDGKPQKHYFLTEEAGIVADRLVKCVRHARWYDDRIQLIKRYFGTLSANDIRNLQYSHLTYRDAQLSRTIPDLPIREVIDHYQRVFREPLTLSEEATDVA